jgi:hypothetical protein
MARRRFIHLEDCDDLIMATYVSEDDAQHVLLELHQVLVGMVSLSPQIRIDAPVSFLLIQAASLLAQELALVDRH